MGLFNRHGVEQSEERDKLRSRDVQFRQVMCVAQEAFQGERPALADRAARHRQPFRWVSAKDVHPVDGSLVFEFDDVYRLAIDLALRDVSSVLRSAPKVLYRDCCGGCISHRLVLSLIVSSWPCQTSEMVSPQVQRFLSAGSDIPAPMGSPGSRASTATWCVTRSEVRCISRRRVAGQKTYCAHKGIFVHERHTQSRAGKRERESGVEDKNVE